MARHPALPKKLKLSLNKKKTASTSELPTLKTNRFSAPVSEEKVDEAAKGVVPFNTKKNNGWAERTFYDCVQERNKLMPGDPVPTDLLQCHDTSVVSKYLRYFVLEARTQDCQKYPPSTLRSLLSELNRRVKGPFSILDKGNPAFRELLLTLDTVTSDLHRE